MKAFNELTISQQQIINNLRAGREIYYPLDNEDIQELIKDGWLIPQDQSGNYLVANAM